MEKLKSPIDKLPCLLLATFLLVSTTNYFYSVKDNFISKNIKIASAETNQKVKNNSQLPVSAKLIHPNVETNFTLPISRNPFRLSSNIALDVIKSTTTNNLSKNETYVAKISYPILNGVIISEKRSSIIALYNGKSNYYELRDKIGPYELKSIKENSIVVSKNGKDTKITLGENSALPPNIKKQTPNSLEKKQLLPSINEELTKNKELTNYQAPSSKVKNNLETIGEKSKVNSTIVTYSK